MRYLTLIGICILLLAIIVNAGDYTPPSIDSVNLSFQTGYTAPDIGSINVTFGQATSGNTCSPDGLSNAVVKCSDFCNFTSPLDMNGFNLTFNESGTITFTEWPTNVNVLLLDGNATGCTIEVG